ncbi:Putative vacuolar amino acid transporter similar to AVT1 of Saccharomyces cerevisiae [Podospora comata]|uniref:Vacuolar amino acid transporter similar to AVT1 of Saccharomyces cerevisiae n=1 Tax=Podospora comata TaxID=48703 RepID=A0ABY6SL05_PODCO|nr:Putative vacuolar amino acid transporter similar to AVT1 of Saccharomyces cerevisiae [Podospora comata]
MASRNNPTTWDQYERGGMSRTGSVSSIGNRSVQFENESLLGRSVDSNQDDGEWPHLRRRRSSITNRLTALTDIGGVNSIRSFTRSWQRAAGFSEVIPQRPSFVFAPDQAHQPIQYGRSPIDTAEQGSAERTSLLHEHFQAAANQQSLADQPIREERESPEPGASFSPGRQVAAADYREREAKALEQELGGPLFRTGMSAGRPWPRRLRSGSSSRRAVPMFQMTKLPLFWSRRWSRMARLFWLSRVSLRCPRLCSIRPSKCHCLLSVFSLVSVLTFRSVLIGVGLLSLPMGIKYAGWIIGMVALFLCAAVTAYTAKLLAKCMDLDPSLITFSDLAFISFGRNARIATSVLFTLELLAACVALIVLFADSLDLLFPGFLSVNGWKVFCALILIPLNFMPLRLLSFTSILGIFSCLSIVLILLLDGFLKPTTPGSLIEPAKTYLLPENWLTLPLSFGLLMSPWGGHSVFPNIYRDMRHPYKYAKALKYSFSFTYILDAVTAVAGLLMFGDDVRDEITSNLLMEASYPRVLTVFMTFFVAIIPLTKIPLNARPIVSTIEVLFGLNTQTVADNAGFIGRSMYFRGVMKVVVRVVVIIVFLVISILFPAFDSIMAFMGSALCFTICVTLPLAFYLKLFASEIQSKERIAVMSMMILSTILSVIGTIWAFLPKSWIGAEKVAADPTYFQ